MNENKENRFPRLGQRRAVRKEYCSCDCHRQKLGDYEAITEERANAIMRTIEGFESFQREDGTFRTFADDLRKRIAAISMINIGW